MGAHKTEKNTNPPTRGMATPAPGVNCSKWTHTKQVKTQIRRRGGMAPPAPGVNSSNGFQKKTEKKTEPPARGGNWGPLKSENDLEGVNFFFFFEIAPDGGPLRVWEGVRSDHKKKPRWVF